MQGARSDIFWLGAILALALVLRVIGLNGPLWYDEILTLETHLRLPWQDMMRSYSMNHHYLYSMEAKAAMGLLGPDPWVLRLPALVFGVAGIAATWFLARDVAGVALAHLTALLLALSYHHIWFSQNARGYTELAFFACLAMILFLRGIERPGMWIWLGFALLMALSVFTHLTGALFFVAVGLVWLGVLAQTAWKGKKKPGLFLWPFIACLVGVGVTFLLYLPILPSLMATIGEVSGTSAVDAVPEYQNPLWTLGETVRSAIGSVGGLTLAIAWVLIGLSIWGGVQMGARGRLFAVAVLAHIVLTMAVLAALGMRIWPRFLFVDIGFLMILIIAGIHALCKAVAGAQAQKIFALACVAMVVVSGFLAARNYTAPKQDLAGAWQEVQKNRSPEDRIFALGYAATAFETHFGADWGRIMDPDAYRKAMDIPGPVTLVLGFPQRVFSRIPELDRDLERGTVRLVHRFPGTLGDGAVLILKR